MAEFVNPIWQISGKYENVIGYVRPGGKDTSDLGCAWEG